MTGLYATIMTLGPELLLAAVIMATVAIRDMLRGN